MEQVMLRVPWAEFTTREMTQMLPPSPWPDDNLSGGLAGWLAGLLANAIAW